MMKDYFVKVVETHEHAIHDNDPLVVECRVYEATVVGQRYENVEGYGHPRYVFNIELMDSFLSMVAAQSYIRGLQAARRDVYEPIYPHPTFTCSANGPGDYPLDKNGGPLFTIAKDAKV